MSNIYAIFSLGKKYKEYGSIANYEKHLLRTIDTPNADPTKLNENMILKGAEKPIIENIKEYISNCKLRKNNVIVRDLLLSVSHEYFKDADLEKRYKWIKANYRFLESEFGENLRFAIVHNDEVGSPCHIHCLICPKFKDKQDINVLSNDRYFGGRTKLVEWQTKYAEAMKELGLTRGIQHSKAKHEDIKLFYSYIDHMEEIEDISNIDPKFITIENMRLKSRVSGLENVVENYKKYLRLEKEAHKKTREEKQELQKDKEKNIDYGFMLDCCLEYLADEKHMTKKDVNKLVEIAVSKGDKLSLENKKEIERGIEYER